MGVASEGAKVDLVFSIIVDKKFNYLSVGKVFSEENLSFVTGCEDGVIRVYDLGISGNSNGATKPRLCLETKSGPVQIISLHDVTKFFSQDIISVDSKGMLTVFHKGQILSRQSLSSNCINCLQISEDATGSIAIVCGDAEGSIYACQAYGESLWKLRLKDFKPSKGLPCKILSLLAVSLPTLSGQVSSYVLASDDHSHLYVLQYGSIVHMLDTPGNITAMCAGRFKQSLEAMTPSSNAPAVIGGSSAPLQVALATDTGAIYIFNNFEIFPEEFANSQMPITNLCTLPSIEASEMDSILCGGHFNSIFIFANNREPVRHQTPDWVNSIITAPSDTNSGRQIILGCRDGSIQSLRLTT